MAYQLGSSAAEQDRLHDHLESFGQKRLLALVERGMRALDVGCGPGAVTALLGRAVGPEGSVVGVDLQDAHLERARAHAEAEGLRHVHFERADATRLPYGDASFDVVYAKFLIMHLPEPRAGLTEMVRVLKPGGRLFIYENDAGGALFWPSGTPTQRAWELTMQGLAEGGSDIYMGRKLYGELTALGLTAVRAIPEMTGCCSGQKGFMEACKRQIVGVLGSLRERLVEHLTGAELDELAEAVMQERPQEFFTLCGMACWGTKSLA